MNQTVGRVHRAIDIPTYSDGTRPFITEIANIARLKSQALNTALQVYLCRKKRRKEVFNAQHH